MKQHLTFCAALVALGLVAAGGAQAQYAVVGPGVYAPGLPPYEIMRIVNAAGLAPLTNPMRRGPSYVLLARDRAGVQVRVVVNAFGGEIVRVRPVVVAMRPYVRPYGPPVAVSPYEPLPPVAAAPPRAGIDGDALPPVPRRAIPESRIATAPSAGAIQAPAAKPRTPLPRPRPNVAANEGGEAAPPPELATAPAETKPAPPSATPAPAPKSGDLKLVPVAPLE